MSRAEINAFLTDPDADARRHELAMFFTPNPAPFLKTFELMRERALARQAGQRPRLRFASLCWPAFLFGPVWFFYRKLWAWGAGIVALIIVLNVIPGTFGMRLGLPLSLALGAAGRIIAVHAAIGRLQAGPRGGLPSGDAAIAQAGGVSRLAGWIAGTIWGGLVLLLLAAVLYLARQGIAPSG